MSQKRESRGPATPTLRTTTPLVSEANPSRSRTPIVAHAVVLRAGPDAVYDRLLVRACPVADCHYAHLHYVPLGAWRAPLVRAPRCRPWLRYRVEVVDVVPATAVAGQRKRSAA